MKILSQTSTKVISLSILACALGLYSHFQLQSTRTTSTSINTLSAGAGICFSRVQQSFTSLMSKELSSNYLVPEFLATTGDCFKSVESSSQKLALSTALLQLAKETSSDYYWFSEKISKLRNSLVNEDIDLLASNVTSKYSELEALVSEMKQKLSQVNSEATQTLGLWSAVSFSAMLILVFASFYEILAHRRDKRNLRRIEKGMAKKVDKEVSQDEASRVVQDVLVSQGMYATWDKVNQYLGPDKSIELGASLNSAIQTPTQQTKEQTNISLILNETIENLSMLIHSKSVTLKTTLGDEFMVVGQEQEITSILSPALKYAINNTKGELVLKTKNLGGSAILNIMLEGHCFNVNELHFLNSDHDIAGVKNTNLIDLKKATNKLYGAMSARNIIDANHTSCSFDFVLQVPSVRSRSVKSVIKGKKSDVLKQLNL